MVRLRVPDITKKKRRKEKVAMLTAYDFPTAALLDQAGIDILLVGDSLGMAVFGNETTISVTLDDMIRHTRAVSRGARRALVVADMPFLTYQCGRARAVRNAGRLLSEGGAAAVKLEGGRAVSSTVRRLTEVGIPVMGHLGLLPQSVHQTGGYRKQAVSQEGKRRLLEEARILERAGVFALVLEAVPDEAALEVTRELSVPTIGIGAGPHCDGQVLVSHDAFGLTCGDVPSFVKSYARIGEAILEAARTYVEEVRSGQFPTARRFQSPDAGQSEK